MYHAAIYNAMLPVTIRGVDALDVVGVGGRAPEHALRVPELELEVEAGVDDSDVFGAEEGGVGCDLRDSAMGWQARRDSPMGSSSDWEAHDAYHPTCIVLGNDDKGRRLQHRPPYRQRRAQLFVDHTQLSEDAFTFSATWSVESDASWAGKTQTVFSPAADSKEEGSFEITAYGSIVGSAPSSLEGHTTLVTVNEKAPVQASFYPEYTTTTSSNSTTTTPIALGLPRGTGVDFAVVGAHEQQAVLGKTLVVDDNAPGVLYTGAWGAEKAREVSVGGAVGGGGGGAVGGGVHRSAAGGGEVSVTFVGTSVSVFGAYEVGASAKYTLDGGCRGGIDVYNTPSRNGFDELPLVHIKHNLVTLKPVVVCSLVRGEAATRRAAEPVLVEMLPGCAVRGGRGFQWTWTWGLGHEGAGEAGGAAVVDLVAPECYALLLFEGEREGCRAGRLNRRVEKDGQTGDAQRACGLEWWRVEVGGWTVRGRIWRGHRAKPGQFGKPSDTSGRQAKRARRAHTYASAMDARRPAVATQTAAAAASAAADPSSSGCKALTAAAAAVVAFVLAVTLTAAAAAAVVAVCTCTGNEQRIQVERNLVHAHVALDVAHGLARGLDGVVRGVDALDVVWVGGRAPEHALRVPELELEGEALVDDSGVFGAEEGGWVMISLGYGVASASGLTNGFELGLGSWVWGWGEAATTWADAETVLVEMLMLPGHEGAGEPGGTAVVDFVGPEGYALLFFEGERVRDGRAEGEEEGGPEGWRVDRGR
ncbi:hypothetical protein DFP72DRAFT_856544 [Ephemerocybe angulata]|uniref:Uncharacterized protein n=1 Tax=Ephemerocybe angulata TaxID=980116 RepID=A0A8H6HE85_9AGAR|nr:hypothetical protein DFP72DRAFT_856544 [Tulosesus angulatus]